MGVKRVIDLARSLDEGGDREKLLSSNLVAGVSVNLPIYKTCRPTKVCAESCYAGRNVPIGMKAAVAKQVRLLNAITADPIVEGERGYVERSSGSPLNFNLFYSYTESEDEEELPRWLLSAPISVYYTNLYKSSAPFALQSVNCPLNGSESVQDACQNCGMCWNGEAVKIRDSRRPIEGRVFSSNHAPSLFDE